MNPHYRSQEILRGPEGTEARVLYKSMGYTEEELTNRPIIGIANSWNTLVPGHFNLRQLAEFVKKGVYRAGGTAVEFGVIGACDGLASGHGGMRYILPSREIICNSIEIMAEAHRLDGLVLLAGCDKIIPGMLMGAVRVNIPSLMVHGGPMEAGVEFDGRKSDETTIAEALGMYRNGTITEEEFHDLEDLVCPTCGACDVLGTANTMACLTEVLGFCLPGGALIPATHAERLRYSYDSGRAVCSLVEKGITPRQILTEASLENAVKVSMAISGSTNAVIHLSALAHEAELSTPVVAMYREYYENTPQIVRVNPAAPWDMGDFWKAGGIPRVQQNMSGLLNTSVITCTGKNLKKNLEEYSFKYPENREVIGTVENPFETKGGIRVVQGNLAPRTGISKPGAIESSLHVFRGRAKVFDSEEEAEKAILNREILPGTVVVIRYEGPKGGPGMREMYGAMKYLYGMGLAGSTAVITDGRFSGTNNGCFVGHISPEAAEGGPIALVEDGDEIIIDIPQGTLEVQVDEEEMAKRRNTWKNPVQYKNIPRGYLEIYAKLASSADKGAILRVESFDSQSSVTDNDYG